MSLDGCKLAEFDHSGSHFAAVTSDNRIKIWKTSNGKLLHELLHPSHLTIGYSCLAFSKSSPTSSSSSGKKEESMYIALGTSRGMVVLWNLATLDAKTFKHPNASYITAVAFSTDKSFFTTGDDRHVCEWLIEGEDETSMQSRWRVGRAGDSPIHALMTDETKHTLIGGSVWVKIWDRTSHSVVARKNGHLTRVTGLCLTSSPDRVASISDGDRIVCVWSDDDRSAVQTITLDDIPHTMSASGDRIAVTTKSGSCCICICDDTSSKPHLLIVSNDILACNFSSQKEPNMIQIARSNGPFPVFQRINIEGKEGFMELESVSVSSGSIMSDRRKKKQSKATVTVIGADLMNPELGSGEPAKKKKKTEDSEDSKEHEKSTTTKGSGGKDIPLELQLRQLEVEGSTPSITSLSTVLTQALESHDRNLLERCLAMISDTKVVNESIRRLPLHLLQTFVDELVQRFTAYPNRVPMLVPWLRAIFTVHAGYMITSDSLMARASILAQSIESRLLHHDRLVRLSGRLDLLTSQISNRTRSEASAADGPLAVVGDDDEDEEDEENAMQEDGDDDDDDDDEEEDSMMPMDGDDDDDDFEEFDDDADMDVVEGGDSDVEEDLEDEDEDEE